MKFFFLITLSFLFVSTTECQYYYKDIVVAQLSERQYLALKTNHIHHVSATSYESDGQPTEDFSLTQEISPEAKTITVNSAYPSTGITITTNNYKFNKLVESVDNSKRVSNTTTYKYDSAGRVSSILTVTEDTFMNSHSEELHQWFYNNGMPEKMLNIKDKSDTTVVVFTKDENGNIGQEDWKRKGAIVETYYYYYNETKQLTDIVRYNSRAKQMLPDFLYQYDAAGRIAQMTEIPVGSSDYMIWKYEYAPNGLKKSEILFDKQKQMVGHIEYAYE